jgi:hypothetical protein
MVFPIQPARGGFRRRIRVGWFIRDFLMRGDSTGHDIYIAYKTAVQTEPNYEWLTGARRRLRRVIAQSKRTRPHERVKVTNEEIEARLPSYMQDHPPRSKTRCCSYNSFEHYIYSLRELGLIENTGETTEAAGKSGSGGSGWHESHPSVSIRAVAGELNSPAWDNISRAFNER